jgi:hypothetical protein
MKHPDEDFDARLARLARATEGVRPRPDFGARVMQAIEREPELGWLQDLLRSARRAIPVAAVVAAVAVFWAIRSESSFDEAMTASLDDAVELEW